MKKQVGILTSGGDCPVLNAAIRGVVRTGWLALGAGVAAGSDVILIPEIPYEPQIVSDAILRRARAGKAFSIVAVAEGAMSASQAKIVG